MDRTLTAMRRVMYILPEDSGDDGLLDTTQQNFSESLTVAEVKGLRKSVCEILKNQSLADRESLVIELLDEATPEDRNPLDSKKEQLWRQIFMCPAPYVPAFSFGEYLSDDEDSIQKRAPLGEASSSTKKSALDGLEDLEKYFLTKNKQNTNNKDFYDNEKTTEKRIPSDNTLSAEHRNIKARYDDEERLKTRVRLNSFLSTEDKDINDFHNNEIRESTSHLSKVSGKILRRKSLDNLSKMFDKLDKERPAQDIDLRRESQIRREKERLKSKHGWKAKAGGVVHEEDSNNTSQPRNATSPVDSYNPSSEPSPRDVVIPTTVKALKKTKNIVRLCRSRLGLDHRATGQAARHLVRLLLELPDEEIHAPEIYQHLVIFARSSGKPSTEEIISWLPILDKWAEHTVLGDANSLTDISQAQKLHTVLSCCRKHSINIPQQHKDHLDQLFKWVKSWNTEGISERPIIPAESYLVPEAEKLVAHLQSIGNLQAASAVEYQLYEIKNYDSYNSNASRTWVKEVLKLYPLDKEHSVKPTALKSGAEEHSILAFSGMTRDEKSRYFTEKEFEFSVRADNILGHEETKMDLLAWARDFTFGIKTNPLCLVGPPGIGKSALLRHFCTSFFPPSKPIVLDVKGWSSSGPLVGWEQKWVGAKPGAIASALMNRGDGPCAIVFDDIDHTSKSPGHSSSQIQEEIGKLMAKELFKDSFFGFPLDLRNCFFFATANSMNDIPDHLRRRIFTIETYTPRDDVLREIIEKKLKEELNSRELSTNVSFELINLFAETLDERTGIPPIFASISYFASCCALTDHDRQRYSPTPTRKHLRKEQFTASDYEYIIRRKKEKHKHTENKSPATDSDFFDALSSPLKKGESRFSDRERETLMKDFDEMNLGTQKNISHGSPKSPPL